VSPRDLRARIKAEADAHRSARDPLERLDAARRLREAADELEASAIEAAREAGTTWGEIGELYGLTKQGAQQRFREKQPRKKR
jgi:hypothetical protein